MGRLLLIAFIFFLIVWLLASLKTSKTADPASRELVRDALTGVYFAKSEALTITLEGRTLYFSSQKNRDQYLAQKRS